MEEFQGEEFTSYDEEFAEEEKEIITFDQVVSLTMIAETIITVFGISAYGIYLLYIFVVG